MLHRCNCFCSLCRKEQIHGGTVPKNYFPAIEKGLINKDANITDENIDRLILNSGFSTVDEVSKLAGRGVGMDVVGNQINILGITAA